MNFKQFLETDRQKGKSLPETGYKDRFVDIYRAVPTTEMYFKPMDYIGIGSYGRRFCIGHAEHQEAVTDEPYHVIRALVPAQHVFEAYNPGEYFYDGPEIKGREIRFPT